MRSFSISHQLWIFLTILLVIAVSTDQQCEAKSWADVVADSPPDTTTTRKGSNNSRPSQQVQLPSTPTAGVYKTLPAGATKYKVRNVYDGDTLTLIDETRVRLLGIDAPELEEKQPFAQEAKQYTKDFCHKKDIYLSFDPSGEKQDKFGRLLAFVWVEVDEGYLCVNEGIVAAGLATVYLANKNSKLPNLKHMISLQKEARTDRRGIWNNFVDCNVLVTRYGSAFHKPGCRHIARSKNLKPMKASEAADQGFHPCRTCLPNG
jgi:endonuclease YncB( thermonuclease family)